MTTQQELIKKKTYLNYLKTELDRHAQSMRAMQNYENEHYLNIVSSNISIELIDIEKQLKGE